MAAYGAVVQRALDAAKTMLEIGEELTKLNATLSREQVTSFDGGQRRLIMTPAPAEVTAWLKQVRSMWSK